MTEKIIKEYYEELTKDDLIIKARIAGVGHSNLTKDVIIDRLTKYMSDEKAIEEIWNGLSSYEKEYMEEFLKYHESPSYKVLGAMQKKHGIESGYFKNTHLDQSKINLFFIKNTIPSQIERELKKHVAPVMVKYDVKDKIPKIQGYLTNIIAESFSKDFCSVIELVKHVNLPLTKKKWIPTKSSVIKIDSILTNKDFVFENTGSIQNIRGFEETNRIYSIVMLLKASRLIYEVGDSLSLFFNTDKFKELKLEDKCRILFTNYIKSKEIYEIDRIVESKYLPNVRGNMTKCRVVIIDHLKNCPVGSWIRTSQFIDYIKIMDKNFLTDQVEYISYFSEKHRMYLDPWVGWEEVEGRFIEVVLQEYLCVMGIVDTVITEQRGGCSDYDELSFFKVMYFRITPLGAYILGMNDEYSYEEPKSTSGFTVLDNLEVKVLNEPANQVHNLFFERFAPITKHPQYDVYSLSFRAIVKALDNQISIESIYEYIKKHSHNGIPNEIEQAFDKWRSKSTKVVIENITVVRTEDGEIMEELKSGLGLRKYITDDLSNAFEIKKDMVQKIKKEIEKKEYYCGLPKES